MRDIEALERVWNVKNQSEFKHLIRECYRDSPDCYQCALTLMFSSSDFFKAKATGLASSIIIALKSWVNGREERFSHLLTVEMKRLALDTVLRQKNRTLISLVCDVYHIIEDRHLFVDTIKALIGMKQHHEAACCIMELKLQDNFSLYDVVIPLILQDRIGVAESYIKDHTSLQLDLVNYLDSLLGDSSAIPQVLKEYSSLPGFRREKLVPKTVNKLLSRILKTYNIPAENCPNFCKVRNQGAMKYLIRRKYIEKNIAEDCWDEMIKEAADNDVELQKELVMQILCSNDTKCALKWAGYYNLPLTEFPKTLYDASLEDFRKDESVHKDENWDEESNKEYLHLRLDISDIHIVETPEDFIKSLDDITENYDMVGIDGEWKPSFGITKSRIALLQMAVWDDVYLFDMLKLAECLSSVQRNELSKKIFCNYEILKVGYGLTADLEMLEEFFQCGEGKLKMVNVLDYRTFRKQLEKCYPDLMSKAEKHSSLENKDFKGLSELTWTILGLPLDKSEQYSDWERRPLRKAQLVYSALDAYCLLQIYEEFYKAAMELNLDFHEVINEPCSGAQQKKKSQKPKQKSLARKQKPSNFFSEAIPTHSPISISDFHVVVDTMLQGLGKYLRICGSDAVILENTDDHTMAAKIAMKEDRIILTSGAPFEMLKKYVPEGRCFGIPNDISPKEQALIVFKNYNVQITEEDIFSRCTMCNGANYIPVGNKELKDIWEKYQRNLFLCDEYNIRKQSDKHDGDNVTSFRCPTVADISGSSSTVYTNSKVTLQLSQLSERALGRIQKFLICSTCGKIYWYGSHFIRVKNSMVDILEEKDLISHTIYDKHAIDTCI